MHLRPDSLKAPRGRSRRPGIVGGGSYARGHGVGGAGADGVAGQPAGARVGLARRDVRRGAGAAGRGHDRPGLGARHPPLRHRSRLRLRVVRAAGRARAARPAARRVHPLQQGRPPDRARRTGHPADLGRAPGRSRSATDYSYGAVLRSFEASLERMGIDRIDILHIHDPDLDFATASTEALRALAELRGRGTIRAISLGVNHADVAARFLRESGPSGPDCILLAGRYTLLDQSGADELLPLCEKLGVAVSPPGCSKVACSPTPPTALRTATRGSHRPARAHQPTPRALPRVRRTAAGRRDPVPARASRRTGRGGRRPKPAGDHEVAAWLDHEIPADFWAALRSAVCGSCCCTRPTRASRPGNPPDPEMLARADAVLEEMRQAGVLLARRGPDAELPRRPGHLPEPGTNRASSTAPSPRRRSSSPASRSSASTPRRRPSAGPSASPRPTPTPNRHPRDRRLERQVQ